LISACLNQPRSRSPPSWTPTRSRGDRRAGRPARRLSHRGVLVRSSRTLEALGRIDVVCFDKTGTLTEGRLSVTRLASADVDLDEADPFARRLLTAAARACPAVTCEHIGTVPHATDRAVLEAANKLSDVDHRNNWRLRAELPFETNRGYALALGDADGGPLLVVKGAPEVVLPLCGSVTGPDSGTEKLTPGRRDAAQQTVQRLAAEGLRVLAVAERGDGLPPGDEVTDEVVADLTLLGLVGVASPAVRSSARQGREGVNRLLTLRDGLGLASSGVEAEGRAAGHDLLERRPAVLRLYRHRDGLALAGIDGELPRLSLADVVQAPCLEVVTDAVGAHVVALLGNGHGHRLRGLRPARCGRTRGQRSLASWWT